MKQASKTNDCMSKIFKTGLCITAKVLRILSRGKTRNPFIWDRGPIFQVAHLNRNLTQVRPSEIQYQPSLTSQNDSLDVRQSDKSRTYHKCVMIVKKIHFEKRGFDQIAKHEFLTACCCILVWGHI